MARPCVAIDAPVLAAAIRIDRAVETDIRRVVASDDRPCRVYGQSRSERRRLFVGRAPAVIERDAPFGLEASALVARRAASLARPDCGRHIHVADILCGENISRTYFVNAAAPHPPADAGPSLCPLSRGEGLNSPSPRLPPPFPPPRAGEGQGGGEGWGEGQVSVIIPTLNAAETLTGVVEQLNAAAIVNDIVIVDAGSSDETVAIAGTAGARVIAAPRGRGIQLAAGADAASGRLAIVPACRLPARAGLGNGCR